MVQHVALWKVDHHPIIDLTSVKKKQSQLTKLLSGSVETLFSCSIFNAVRSKEKHLYALLLLLVNTIVSSLVSGIKLTGAHERHCPLLIITPVIQVVL